MSWCNYASGPWCLELLLRACKGESGGQGGVVHIEQHQVREVRAKAATGCLQGHARVKLLPITSLVPSQQQSFCRSGLRHTWPTGFPRGHTPSWGQHLPHGHTAPRLPPSPHPKAATAASCRGLGFVQPQSHLLPRAVVCATPKPPPAEGWGLCNPTATSCRGLGFVQPHSHLLPRGAATGARGGAAGLTREKGYPCQSTHLAQEQGGPC